MIILFWIALLMIVVAALPLLAVCALVGALMLSIHLLCRFALRSVMGQRMARAMARQLEEIRDLPELRH